MWKNNVEWGRPQKRKLRMPIPCWITKAANMHSEYVILIAFPLQKLLQEHVSVLGYAYIACHLISTPTNAHK